MKFSSFVYLLSLLVFISCERSRSKQNTPRNSGVVLIFNQIPENSAYTFSNGIRTSNGEFTVRYINDFLLPEVISPNPNSNSDTIRITSKREIIEIQHAYRGIDRLSFLIMNGDTAKFTYDKGRPHLTILNRTVNEIESNYEVTMREVIYQGDFPSVLKHQYPFAFMQRSNSKQESNIEEWQKRFKVKALAEIHQENSFLDSICKSSRMSKDICKIYALQNKYDSLRFYYQIDKPLKVPSNYLAHDSLLYYGFYNEFLDAIIFRHYASKVARVKTKGFVNPDFTAIYDSIRVSNLYSKQTKMVLLEKTMNAIIADQPIDIVKRYFDDFNETINDTIHSAFLKNKFRLNFDNTINLNLIEQSGGNITYDEILSSRSGNLVYVDFWASWCGPCIGQFPYSKKLRENFSKKGVSFIYISIDTDSVKWLKATNKYNLENSYLVDNLYSSTLTNKLKVTTIPRYLLYDKNGQIVHENAPRPDSKEIIKLFEKYLKK